MKVFCDRSNFSFLRVQTKSTFTRVTLIWYMVKYKCSRTKHKWQLLGYVAQHRKCMVLPRQWQTRLSATFCGTCVARYWPDILIKLPIHTIDTSCADTRKSASCLLRFSSEIFFIFPQNFQTCLWKLGNFNFSLGIFENDILDKCC